MLFSSIGGLLLNLPTSHVRVAPVAPRRDLQPVSLVVEKDCRVVSIWRDVLDAIRAYVGEGQGLTEEERRAVRVVLKLYQ